MGLFDRLFGRDDRDQGTPVQQPGRGRPASAQAPAAGEDERAIARYRYLLRTAPPEQVEQAHAEAFAQLTPEQRRQVLGQLTGALPAGEAPADDSPQTLARAATRAEMRRPGTLQRSFGGGPGMGGMFAGSMLGSIAGVVIGSAIAQSLLGGFEQSPEAGEVGEGDAGGDTGGDAGGAEDAGGDMGGDTGGDFGGGADFGGGDFGADFGGGFGDF